MSRRTIALSILLLLLTAGAAMFSARKFMSQALSRQSPPEILQCDARCSDEKLRTSIADLTLISAESQLGQLAIEVTVYKDGFARGVFARLSPIRADQRFILIQPNEQERVSGLDKLVAAQVTLVRDLGQVVVRVEGLEPGLNYFWRLRSADGATTFGQPVRCRAAICPADEVQEQTIPR